MFNTPRHVALLLFSFIWLSPVSASQIQVDESLTLAQLIKASDYIFVVSHVPPSKPLIGRFSLIHFQVNEVLKPNPSKQEPSIQVVHFQDDLLKALKKSQEHEPKKSLLIRGYKSPGTLEESLKKRFILFLVKNGKEFHFAAPGSFESLESGPKIRKILKAKLQ